MRNADKDLRENELSFSAEGMSISPVTTEISIEFPQKLKHRAPI
jgi:hypothetical protein